MHSNIDEENEVFHQENLSPYPAGSKAALMTQTVLVNSSNINEGINLKEMLNQIELEYIKEALINTKGVVSLAAQKLGLRRTTLIEKIKKYNIAK